MALLDFLKRKSAKSRQSRHSGGPAVISPKASLGGKDKLIEKSEPVGVDQKKTSRGKAGTFSYSVIKEPHISEKATDLADKKNQYVFEVLNSSNKTEIKKSVEGVYGVKVLSVNIIKIPKKKRRIGRTQGFKKGFTKAVVKIKQGDKIEIL